MIFKYAPFLQTMIELYQIGLGPARFEAYLSLVQTADKKGMQHPLSFFNPMAKPHVLEKLIEMKQQGFEELMQANCLEQSTTGETLKVYFNLADDIGGGWTTKDSTHDMSLEIAPFIKRGLCVIVFYVSENITPELIAERVKFYADLYNSD